MKKRLTLSLLVLIAAATAAWAWWSQQGHAEAAVYRTAEVRRGDLESVVSGTGTLSAVGTVEVGTQVSGTIDRLLVDFNDHVHQGQLLAVLDTSALAASVRDGEAGVARSRAQYRLSKDEYDRHLPLAEKGYLSAQELRALETGVEVARANLQSAEATLRRASTNLGYTEIRAPIDGTVIQRNVEAGQTVAASLSAPTLFVIARNLERMEILALVDESDIGQIREGQAVRFTVQSYPERTFTGQVRQVRLQPETIQNVVNYTVVVEADNPERVLLPGMTATVDFIVECATDVLTVAAAALRFEPSPELVALPGPPGLELPAPPRQGTPWGGEVRLAAGPGAGSAGPPGTGRLCVQQEGGALRMVPVRVGISDGVNTEVSALPFPGAPELTAGMSVISGTAALSTPTPSAARGRRMGPPPQF